MTRGVCAAVAALGIAGGVGGCGAVETLTSTPTITEHTATPDAVAATTAAGASGGTGAPALPSPTGSSGAGPGQPGGGATAPAEPASSERLVVVKERGIAFAVPAAYTSVDPQEQLPAGGANPLLDQLADQLGVGAAELRSALADKLDLILLESPTGDFATNVIVSPSPPGLEAEALQAQLGQTFGIAAGEVRSITTALGPAVRIDYTLPEITPGAHGSVLVVPGGEPGGVMITVSAGSKRQADDLAERVAATLRAA